MAFIYDLSAVEILKRLGYMEPVGKERLLHAAKEMNVKLPSILFDFLSLAANAPLLSTADLWTNRLDSLYGEIEERIDDEQEYWEENPEEYSGLAYFQLSKLPKEQWESLVPDYLLIGSDFGAGVAQFGIRFTDLGQNSPPVYMHHECNPITDWRLWNHSLSSFLMQVLCDVLYCENYDTAACVLGKAGWASRMLSQEALAEYAVNTAAMLKQKALYGITAMCGCAYDEERKLLLVAKADKSNEQDFKCIAYQKNDTL